MCESLRVSDSSEESERQKKRSQNTSFEEVDMLKVYQSSPSEASLKIEQGDISVITKPLSDRLASEAFERLGKSFESDDGVKFATCDSGGSQGILSTEQDLTKMLGSRITPPILQDRKHSDSSLALSQELNKQLNQFKTAMEETDNENHIDFALKEFQLKDMKLREFKMHTSTTSGTPSSASPSSQ